MAFFRAILGLVASLAMFETVFAGMDLSSNSTVVVYWGQNSFRGSGELAQQPLGYYCDDFNIDVIVLAFLMTINGPGGAPEIDFATSSEKCDTFDGTNLKNCPEIGEDITKCQSKGKTILLSIGGATYTEGGFESESAADAGANLLWATFGPDQGDSKVHRPFGKAAIDGFDFDFEAAITNTRRFATKLRSLTDADSSKKYYLTAAPQCPYPDAADKDILNTNSSAAVDAVFVQFYNNNCGVDAYTPATESRAMADNNFNFDVWDHWALTESKNKNVRVFLGVPANTGAASTGYLPAEGLAPVIEYSKSFESFGGVMMWDVSQAYGNQGFLDGVHSAMSKGAQQHAAQETTETTPPAASSSTQQSASPSPEVKPPQQGEQSESEAAEPTKAQETQQEPQPTPQQVAPEEEDDQQQQNQDSLLSSLLQSLGLGDLPLGR